MAEGRIGDSCAHLAMAGAEAEQQPTECRGSCFVSLGNPSDEKRKDDGSRGGGGRLSVVTPGSERHALLVNSRPGSKHRVHTFT